MTPDLQELLGYLSSVVLVSTFYMKTMIPLRITAIIANVCMIVFTAMIGLWPVLIAQAVMLPLNLLRLWQIHKATQRIREAANGDLNLDALVRYMKPESHPKDEVLFREGDPSDKMYLIRRGKIRLEGIGAVLETGEVFGEIGIVAPGGKRTATAICDEDCELLSITQAEVTRLYYVDPGFGWYLIRLVTQRLLHNLESAQTAVAPDRIPTEEREPLAEGRATTSP